MADATTGRDNRVRAPADALVARLGVPISSMVWRRLGAHHAPDCLALGDQCERAKSNSICCGFFIERPQFVEG